MSADEVTNTTVVAVSNPLGMLFDLSNGQDGVLYNYV